MLCEFLCRVRIVILTSFSDKNISRINISAHSVRNIACFCKHMFNDYIFDILCIAWFCNFFRNISLFLCLISWSISVESICSRFLRRAFMLSLMHTSFYYSFLRVISRFLFIISNAWSRRLFSSFSPHRFWCFETYFWLLFRVSSFQISRAVKSLSRRRFWLKNRWISIFSCFFRKLFWRSSIFWIFWLRQYFCVQSACSQYLICVLRQSLLLHSSSAFISFLVFF